MNKLFIFIVIISILKCEKPQPQRPKVISSHTYFDTIASVENPDQTLVFPVDSIKILPEHQSDSISVVVGRKFKFIKYTNVADEMVDIAYIDTIVPRRVNVKFPKESLYTSLVETGNESNVYSHDNVKWDISENRRLGKLTINGIWFEFIRKD